MPGRSEYDTPPRYLVTHSPALLDSLALVQPDSLKKYHYLAVPDRAALYEEFSDFLALLKRHGVHSLELIELLSHSQQEYARSLRNPNLMFTRDSAVTLPWAPQVFIQCRFSLASREREAAIMARALTNLGLKRIADFEADEFLEGGDVLPVIIQNRRVLVVGFGQRTTQAAALKLAKRLIPDYTDEIIGIRHDSRVLHLDTGFTVLSQQHVLAAREMFHQGFAIGRGLQLEWLNPLAYAKELGLKVIYVEKEDAIAHERCNLLPLGNGHFVSFSLTKHLRQQITEASGIKLLELPGHQLAKAAGGVHCLSRPIY